MTAKDKEEKDDPSYTNPAFVKEEYEDEGIGGLGKEEKEEDKESRSDGDGTSESESLSSLDSNSPSESPRFNLKMSPRPKRKAKKQNDEHHSPVSFRSGYQSNRSSISSARKGILKKSISTTTINMEMTSLSRPQTPTECDEDAISNGDVPRLVRTATLSRVKFILDSGKPDTITGDYDDIKMENKEKDRNGSDRNGKLIQDDDKDDGMSKSGKKCLVFSAGVLIVTMAVILGSFFGSRKTGGKPQNVISAKKLIDNALEGRFAISSLEFAPYFYNLDSNEAKNISSKLEETMIKIFFVDESVNQPNSTIKLKIVKYEKGSVIAIFRIKWDGEMTLRASHIRKRVSAHLNQYDAFGEYKLKKSTFSITEMRDLCDAQSCSHICYLSTATLRFACSCPDNLILTNKTECISPTLTTTTIKPGAIFLPDGIGELIQKITTGKIIRINKEKVNNKHEKSTTKKASKEKKKESKNEIPTSGDKNENTKMEEKKSIDKVIEKEKPAINVTVTTTSSNISTPNILHEQQSSSTTVSSTVSSTTTSSTEAASSTTSKPMLVNMTSTASNVKTNKTESSSVITSTESSVNLNHTTSSETKSASMGAPGNASSTTEMSMNVTTLSSVNSSINLSTATPSTTTVSHEINSIINEKKDGEMQLSTTSTTTALPVQPTTNAILSFNNSDIILIISENVTELYTTLFTKDSTTDVSATAVDNVVESSKSSTIEPTISMTVNTNLNEVVETKTIETEAKPTPLEIELGKNQTTNSDLVTTPASDSIVDFIMNKSSTTESSTQTTTKQVITIKGIPLAEVTMSTEKTTKLNRDSVLLIPEATDLQKNLTKVENSQTSPSPPIDFGLIANVSHDLSVPMENVNGSKTEVVSSKEQNTTIPENVQQCKTDEFKCLDGESESTSCVSLLSQCDSVSDCRDNSDEKECIENKCRSNYQCRWSGDCLARKYVCDGVKHCTDGDDEEGCETWKCNENEFKCDMNSSSLCIPMSLRCDGHSDCLNGTDELDCFTECPKDQFFCNEGKCIPNLWECDGRNDCLGGEDESNCGCEGLDQSRCAVGGCVPTFKLCDGLRHCPDGSDEWGCLKIDNETKQLQVRSSSGRWSAVCGDKWTAQWTDLVCEQLGYGVSLSTEVKRVTESVPVPRVKLSPDAPELSRRNRAPLQYFFTHGQCEKEPLVHISCKNPRCGEWTYSAPDAALNSDASEAEVWPSFGLLVQPETYVDETMAYSYSCAASIITPTWVLASYSCLESKTDGFHAEKWALLVGEKSPSNGKNTQRRYANKIVAFPGAKRLGGLWVGDSALLRLQTPLTFDSSTQPICLSSHPAQSHDHCIIAAWKTKRKNGKEEQKSQIVQNLPVPNLTQNTCNTSYYHGKLKKNHTCASFLQDEKSKCTGPEGSPLMCRRNNGTWYLQGLLSHVGNCANFNLPSVFTDVSSIESWVLSTIGRDPNGEGSSILSKNSPEMPKSLKLTTTELPLSQPPVASSKVLNQNMTVSSVVTSASTPTNSFSVENLNPNSSIIEPEVIRNGKDSVSENEKHKDKDDHIVSEEKDQPVAKRR